jgi:hypothetical protein
MVLISGNGQFVTTDKNVRNNQCLWMALSIALIERGIVPFKINALIMLKEYILAICNDELVEVTYESEIWQCLTAIAHETGKCLQITADNNIMNITEPGKLVDEYDILDGFIRLVFRDGHFVADCYGCSPLLIWKALHFQWRIDQYVLEQVNKDINGVDIERNIALQIGSIERQCITNHVYDAIANILDTEYPLTETQYDDILTTFNEVSVFDNSGNDNIRNRIRNIVII